MISSNSKQTSNTISEESKDNNQNVKILIIMWSFATNCYFVAEYPTNQHCSDASNNPSQA